MPHFALSTLVAFAIVASDVYAQSSSTSSSLVPLASKHFDYNNLVRIFLVSVLALFFNRLHSHTKLTPTPVFVARNSVTTSVTRRRKISRATARLPSSTRSTVICSLGIPFSIFGRSHQPIFRFLSLGSSNWSRDHRRHGGRGSRVVHQARSRFSSYPRWCPSRCSVHEDPRLRSGRWFHRPDQDQPSSQRFRRRA